MHSIEFQQCNIFTQRIAHLLLSRNADVNAKNKLNTKTALHLSVWKSDKQWINFILQAGADPTIKNSSGQTPLESYLFYHCADRIPVDSDIVEMLERAQQKSAMRPRF